MTRGRASIRPRLFSRGNICLDIWTGFQEIASIRPRLFSRGNRKTSNCRSAYSNGFNSATTFQPWKPEIVNEYHLNELGFNSATTFQPWKQSPAPGHENNGKEELQFGHDFSAVETSIVEGRLDNLREGFNSATTFQPWKLLSSGLPFPESLLLQFGHDFSAVETSS